MLIYNVATFHGTRLMMKTETGLIVHNEAEISDHTALYLWRDPQHPQWVFLLPERASKTPMRLTNDFETSHIISFFGFKNGESQLVFRHPMSGQILSAIETIGGFGEVIANREVAREWETFTLYPVSDPPAHVRAEVTALESLLDGLDSGPKILAYLQRGERPCPPGGIGAILRLLPIDQLEWLARALISSQVAVKRLAALMPDDLWASVALPDLLAHRMKPGKGKATRRIDAKLGHLATSGMWGKYATIGQRLNSFARRAIPAAKDICIVAAARNEGLYFLEWLAYHRALGVDAFFIYTNDNDDGSDGLLSALAKAGVITWISINTIPDINPQHMAYGHAFQIMPDILDYRWTAVIDLDEFIVLDAERFPNIKTFLTSQEWQKTDAIALSWVMFGPDGQTRRSNLPVTRRFLKREPAIHPLIKSINRSCVFMHSRCHNPQWDEFTSFVYRNAIGAPYPQIVAGDVSALAPHPLDQGAWINHYYQKSAEEFILRRAKSPPERLARTPSGEFFKPLLAQNFFNIYHQLDMVEDVRIFKCVPDLEREMHALLAIPGVQAALQSIEALYATRVRRLASLLADDPRFNVPGSPEQWFTQVLSAP